MLHRLYQRVLALAASRHAPLWLVLVAVAEGSIFPIPPDVLLIPMALSRPRRAWWLALCCTLASVAGGMLGYGIGALLLREVAMPLIRAYGYEAAFSAFTARYAQYGLWIILIKGLTPIPYKIVAIASGAAHYPFVAFVLASLVSRGARFFLLAALLRRFGDAVRVFIERRLTLVTTVLALAIVGGFVALRLL